MSDKQTKLCTCGHDEKEHDQIGCDHEYSDGSFCSCAYTPTDFVAQAIIDTLKASVAELEQRRTFDAGVIDGLNVAIKIKDERIAELEAAAMMFIEADNTDESDWPLSLRDAAMRFHELFPSNEQDATLTPRKFGTCTKSAEQMREAAADISDNPPMLKDINGQWIGLCESISYSIRALPIPTCGDCNPLAPSQHDADSFIQQMKECLLSIEFESDRVKVLRSLGVCLLCGSTDKPCYCSRDE